MKKPASVFITLYLLCTISEITCYQFDSCKSINEQCSSDYDCCYEKCTFSLFTFRSYCRDNTNLYQTLKSYFRTTEEQTGICSYNKNLVTETVSDGMFFTYSFNAAHAVLKPGTRVEVKLDDKKFIVTINSRPSQNNDVILEFSKETARALNIKDGGKVPCSLTIVPELENNSYYKYLKYTLPYIAVFTFLFRLFL